MPMSIQAQHAEELLSKSKEAADFFRVNLPKFDSVDQEKATELVSKLAKGHSYDKVLSRHFANDVDQLARAAGYAFLDGRISRGQASSILEFREMRLGFADSNSTLNKIRLVHFFDENNRLAQESQEILPHFVSSEEKEKFLKLLIQKPKSEQCFFVVNIPKSLLENNEKLAGLLELSHNLKIIIKSPKPVIIRGYEAFTDLTAQPEEEFFALAIFSVSARDALTRAIYNRDAKSLYASLGKFNIDDIEDSIRRYGRYASTAFPGVEDETSFHQVTARVFFLTLHDEAHRRLISSIPTSAYDSLLQAIDVIRGKTNIKWSKEIWDTLDMEVGEFLSETQAFRDQVSPLARTHAFSRLLNAKVYTEDRPMGLFTDSPFIETTWLLMIDIVLNENTWKVLSIDANAFPEHSFYKDMLDFIQANKQAIVNEPSPTKQVAIMMSNYFNLPSQNLEDVKFEKKGKYLQLTKGTEPFLLTKERALLLENIGQYRSVVVRELQTGHLSKAHSSLEQLTKLIERIGILEKENKLLNLFQKGTLRLVDLISFTEEEFKELHFRVIDLLEAGKLSIEKVKQLCTSGLIKVIKELGIYELILKDKLNISDLEGLSSEELTHLKDLETMSLVMQNEMTLSDLKEKKGIAPVGKNLSNKDLNNSGLKNHEKGFFKSEGKNTPSDADQKILNKDELLKKNFQM